MLPVNPQTQPKTMASASETPTPLDHPDRVHQPGVQIPDQEIDQPLRCRQVCDEEVEQPPRVWRCRFCPRMFQSQHAFAGHQHAHKFERAVERGEVPAVLDQNNTPPPPVLSDDVYPHRPASFNSSRVSTNLITSQQRQYRGWGSVCHQRQQKLDVSGPQPLLIFEGHTSDMTATSKAAAGSNCHGRQEKDKHTELPPLPSVMHMAHGCDGSYTRLLMVRTVEPYLGMDGGDRAKAPIFPIRGPAPVFQSHMRGPTPIKPHLISTNTGGAAEIGASQVGLPARPLGMNPGAMKGERYQTGQFEQFIWNSQVTLNPSAQDHQPVGAFCSLNAMAVPPPQPPAYEQSNYPSDLPTLNLLPRREKGGDEAESEESKRRRIEDESLSLHLALPGSC